MYLYKALKEVQSNETIKVLNGTTETTAATLTSGKVGVTLDLNGNTITVSTIYNSGSLAISSSTTGGVLSGTGSDVINNGNNIKFA